MLETTIEVEPLEFPGRDVFTVSRLNQEARFLLESSFPSVWVEGEISNLARPSSGHLYFTLKDQTAQVKCAFFRNRQLHLPFSLGNGMHVLARARVSLYEGRGDYQLIVEHLEEAGDGALRLAFEALKQRLAGEGLFAMERKRALPAIPQQIGVITSPTGAAIRDIVSVLKRRFPAIPVLIYPVPVQGEGAAEQIAAAIHKASQCRHCDVLIVARGGGSLEDLWAFNEECVARAIYACAVPVVVGVGHEVDITIADFVADKRAPTPSAAAELVSPNSAEWLQQFQRIEERLRWRLREVLEKKQQHLSWLQKRLEQQHPSQRLLQQSQRLDELEQRLERAWQVTKRHCATRIAELTAKLYRHDPRIRLHQLESIRGHLTTRLLTAMRINLERRKERFTATLRALETVSPLATLSRGYAIVKKIPGEDILRDTDSVRVGEKIEARLARGRLYCTVDELIDDEHATKR